jgi:uncharacterized protein
MRRFESTRSVQLQAPGGQRLEAWLAESFAARLAGLAALPALAPGRGLLLPRCRSVHTAGMRFAIDVAFLSWPPVHGRCDVIALRPAVLPFRIVAPAVPRCGIAALEASAGTLADGWRPGVRVHLSTNYH